MAVTYESRKTTQSRVKMAAPDMSVLRQRSFVSGTNYTCAVCGQACTSLEQFRLHAAEAHEARNKEPFLGRI